MFLVYTTILGFAVCFGGLFYAHDIDADDRWVNAAAIVGGALVFGSLLLALILYAPTGGSPC